MPFFSKAPQAAFERLALGRGNKQLRNTTFMLNCTENYSKQKFLCAEFSFWRHPAFRPTFSCQNFSGFRKMQISKSDLQCFVLYTPNLTTSLISQKRTNDKTLHSLKVGSSIPQAEKKKIPKGCVVALIFTRH